MISTVSSAEEQQRVLLRVGATKGGAEGGREVSNDAKSTPWYK